MKKIIVIFMLLLGGSLSGVYAQYAALERQLAAYVQTKKAVVGIGVLTDEGDSIVINNEIHYPLLSVFKLHVALTVLDKMNAQGTPTDSVIHIPAAQMQKDTYSPLRNRYPDRDIEISLGELMEYALALSDNNACDVLIGYAGGIRKVEECMRRWGMTGFQLTETEESMHRDPRRVYLNWSRPLEVARLLKMVNDRPLFAPVYKEFLWNTLEKTSTGVDKLKAGLPEDVVLGHKTGSSDRNAEGMKAADNDAGRVVLPDGRRYYIAVFVKDSREDDAANAALIARVSQLVYEALK